MLLPTGVARCVESEAATACGFRSNIRAASLDGAALPKDFFHDQRTTESFPPSPAAVRLRELHPAAALCAGGDIGGRRPDLERDRGASPRAAGGDRHHLRAPRGRRTRQKPRLGGLSSQKAPASVNPGAQAGSASDELGCVATKQPADKAGAAFAASSMSWTAMTQSHRAISAVATGRLAGSASWKARADLPGAPSAPSRGESEEWPHVRIDP